MANKIASKLMNKQAKKFEDKEALSEYL